MICHATFSRSAESNDSNFQAVKLAAFFINFQHFPFDFDVGLVTYRNSLLIGGGNFNSIVHVGIFSAIALDTTAAAIQNKERN